MDNRRNSRLRFPRRVPPLRGARRKFDRAKEHLSLLNAEIAAYKADPYVPWSDVERERRGQLSGRDLRPLDPHIGLVFADLIHNLRAALEYAVYSPGTPPSGFPVYWLSRSKNRKRRTYSKDGVKGIERLPPKAQEFIASIQPYHRWHRRLGLLGTLQTLWTAEKHRTVPVIAGFGQILYGQDFPAGYDHLAEDVDFTVPDLSDASVAAGWWKPLYVGDDLQPRATIDVFVRVGRDYWNVEGLAPSLLGYVGWILDRLEELL